MDRDIAERGKAEQMIEKRAKEMAMLLEASRILTSTLDLDVVLQNITESAANIVELETSAIYLLENDKLYLGATTPPLPEDFPDSYRYAPLIDHPHIQKALKTGRPLIVPDTSTENLTPAERGVCEIRGLRSILYIPLMVKEQALGILMPAFTKKPGVFSETDIEICAMLAHQAALAIINAQLHQKALQYTRELEDRMAERQQTEHALKESREQLRTVVEKSPVAMALVNMKGIIEYINLKAIETFGYQPQDIPDMDRWWAQAYPDETYRDQVIAQWTDLVNKAFINKHEIAKREYRVTCKDGTVKTVLIFGVWIGDKVLAVFDDISERKRFEEELLRAQKLESIGTLAGGIAHDFNNLLQGIFGYISLAKLKRNDPEESGAALENAEKALHMSVKLTNQLLTFSKGGNPVKTVIDLESVIESAAKFALSGSRSNYRISVEDGLWLVDADEGQIAQVVQNIVLNADQAMPEGGIVEVAIRNIQDPRQGPPFLLGQGCYVEIAISDTGLGIPEKDLLKIFDPYFTTKQKGSGLGLATSYSIVKNHGGFIDATSALGKGTTFRIYLPAAVGVKPEEKAVPIPEPVAKRARILLMDDEKVILSVGGELIKALGHDVIFAADGVEAIEKYRSSLEAGSPVDVAILDLTIRGGMGGAETLKKLLEIAPDVKAVVSSGYSDDSTIAAYEKQGFKAVLKKPYNIAQLGEVLNRLLRK
jgi:two-component system cell cycle sensor histidine kinase/response regulator CckA